MKTKILILVQVILFGIIFSGFQGCSKYEDNNMISFTSRASRVANVWKIENYKKNGNDFTSFYSESSETFTKSGDYFYNWGIFGGSGTWIFTKNFTEIQLTGTENQQSHNLVILKLEQKQFWYYYMDGGDKIEIHLIQK